MKFIELDLAGAYLIEMDLIDDDRGFFARSFCSEEFELQGLSSKFVQCNISHNKVKGTLRGMHYQVNPYDEAKLVRCTHGALYDVIIDLRPESSTYKEWIAVELTCDNHRQLFIPEGFAHGYQTLVDNTQVFYQMSQYYHPSSARGIRWNDPAFNIEWPINHPIVNERDKSFDLW
ncbi:dTDP-4-dehydrorhamnose 3,5-epimerase [Mesobacillus subterraneus]|uniref:dTDP-4-dehydrorhamnose 3,5-epimerase n=1 Tax=Mesobacillus subterraneus TaxID=285983 RepID=UPI001CFCF534|nr:dTDP-4-dehydrorhamnose 3,5-epimerase [Mesobacillus subterraneus]